MGCPAEVEIGDNLVFSICTHDPDTGVLTDADTVPDYWVYEDETGVAILSGTMAKLDDANTTGFYTESLACTSGNGFENGKTYTVYIEATVDSDKGGISYGFKAYNPRPSQAEVDRNADLIESQRGYHTWQGNVYYVDPVNGNDSTGDGSRALPYATIQAAHDDLVTDSNHDVIFLLAGAAAGVTTHTVAAVTTISKRYTFIRGPGRDFIITRTGAGHTLAITADGVEISGVQIGTAAVGAGDGINITDADFHRVHNCWFLDTQGDGVHILRGSNTQIHHNHFEGTGVGGTGQGIHVVGTAGSSNNTVIHHNHFANTAGDSILIEQGTTDDTAIHHNEIHDAGGWGINIGASANDTLIHNNFFGNNVSGNINDGGATTVIANNEQWAKAGTTRDDLDDDFTTVQKNSIADTILQRDMDQVEGAAPEHSLCTIVLATLESSISGTLWTIKQTDGSTVHVTKTVTVDADADPITGVD